MLTDSQGRSLWVVDEFGRHTPVESHKDIQNRPRGGAEPDWWVVAKDQAWTPPEPRSLLHLGAKDSGSAAAGGGSASGTKTGAGGKPQPYGWHGYYGEAGGGTSSGPVYRGKVTLPHEMRGKVTPPAPRGKVIPPPPPAPRQPHLTYSQKSGELHDADGGLMDKGHSGFGDYKDKPEFEDVKDRGVIPRGNYKVTEVIEDTTATDREKMGQHTLRLEPADKETRERLKEMNRDGFWIHEGKSPTASRGCILLDKATRQRISSGALVRVTL